jgi:hypothetical protein
MPNLRAAVLAAALPLLAGTLACPRTILARQGTGEPAAAAPRTPSPAQAAQQQRMRDCTAQAAERHLAGDARRAFMSTCLSGRPAAAPRQPGN